MIPEPDDSVGTVHVVSNSSLNHPHLRPRYYPHYLLLPLPLYYYPIWSSFSYVVGRMSSSSFVDGQWTSLVGSSHHHCSLQVVPALSVVVCRERWWCLSVML